MSKQLYKATALVGIMTLISRLMGFARDMLMANLFGVTPATDAFFVAFKIPNFLRRLFAEGAFAQAFVPVLSERRNQDPQSLKPLLDRLTGTLLLILLALTIVGMIGAPVLILLFAPGFYLSGGEFELASNLLSITIPYLLLVTLVALGSSVLNAFSRFAIPALIPVLLNICLMLAAIYGKSLFPQQPVFALAWGVLAAGILQLFALIPSLARLGLLPRPRWGWRHKDVQRIINAMPAAVVAGAVVQLNLLIGTVVASFLPSGSVSWLYYSDRLVEFPLGILGVAVASVVLPRLADNHAQQNIEHFSASLDWGLRLVTVIGLPATLGLMLLSEPLVSSLFQYNAFSAEDAHMASRSLQAFSSGLLAYVLIKVLVPGFTARHDVKTPLRIGWYSVVINLILACALALPLAHGGVALATSIAAYCNAFWLLGVLLKTRNYRPLSGWWRFAGQVCLATSVMALWIFYFVDSNSWHLMTATHRVLQLLATIGKAMLLYVGTLALSGMRAKHLGIQH